MVCNFKFVLWSVKIVKYTLKVFSTAAVEIGSYLKHFNLSSLFSKNSCTKCFKSRFFDKYGWILFYHPYFEEFCAQINNLQVI